MNNPFAQLFKRKSDQEAMEEQQKQNELTAARQRIKEYDRNYALEQDANQLEDLKVQRQKEELLVSQKKAIEAETVAINQAKREQFKYSPTGQKVESVKKVINYVVKGSKPIAKSFVNSPGRTFYNSVAPSSRGINRAAYGPGYGSAPQQAFQEDPLMRAQQQYSNHQQPRQVSGGFQGFGFGGFGMQPYTFHSAKPKKPMFSSGRSGMFATEVAKSSEEDFKKRRSNFRVL
jgi:hypothetical protein